MLPQPQVPGLLITQQVTDRSLFYWFGVDYQACHAIIDLPFDLCGWTETPFLKFSRDCNEAQLGQ